MGSPELVPNFNDAYGESEPLSPRTYNDPGPPPPIPPAKRTSKPRQDHIDRVSPRSTGFPESSLRAPRTSVLPAPSISIHTIPEAYGRLELGSGNSDRSASSGNISKPRRTPAPLALRTQASNSSNSQSKAPQQLNPLLRSAPLPLRNQESTDYNSNPSAIKATVLERKVHNNNSLRTPLTGVPMTPYSPYMPFTPLTPMTPSRLVTKEERKKQKKEEGRRVATINDAVQEESDMWGDACP